MNVATEGQAGTEMSQLTEDQALRKEALQRTSQNTLTQLGITKARALEKAQQTQTRGTEDEVRGLQKTGESLEQQMESQASQMGQWKETQAIQAKNASATAASQTATSGGGQANISGNWMDYYKGWDPTSAAADYRAVYGNDLSRLQASKPL